jgi:hypothetical protein
VATRDICKSRESRESRRMSKYENRRYNKDETSKQFYLRRKKETNEILESDAWKNYMAKGWDEYKKANIK